MDSDNRKITHQNNIKIVAPPSVILKMDKRSSGTQRQHHGCLQQKTAQSLGIPAGKTHELWIRVPGPVGIFKIFHHHEDREKIMDIVQKGSQYHLSPIKEATRKSNLSAMILHGNHKSANTNLNAADLEK